MKTKKALTVLCAALFAAALLFAGCGGGGGSSPQSLAKQTYDEFIKAAKAEGLNTNDKGGALFLAFAGWGMQMDKDPTPAYAKIAEKVKALSAADEVEYGKELAKLLGVE